MPEELDEESRFDGLVSPLAQDCENCDGEGCIECEWTGLSLEKDEVEREIDEFCEEISLGVRNMSIAVSVEVKGRSQPRKRMRRLQKTAHGRRR